ncbi:fad dependent oxidoreductase superfamily [Pyrenophora seminiperda CCB06]|uniref:Fad dependent oxidoreductase superfamily n=1 Tax=Pyrenophora seminiperda CCB06 TaxID=1302712 RepID=A0A3M7M9P7_9PLEO|nr:fad dependent oxidoreductase superfamily [Pyrenophora seminiperda CCB06]
MCRCGYAGATTAYWIHKYTEKSPKQPKVTLLEARGICEAATGRNGGQLRPHLYSRYTKWSSLFGRDVAMDLIRHEYAHLSAFKELAEEEGITEEVCLKLVDTFDAAMTDEAWARLKGVYEHMQKEQGDDAIFKLCKLLDDPHQAEEFSQMKGAIGAITHPSGQIWPYKFVHAILRIVLEKGNLNLQANTPVVEISEKDANGWITLTTERGSIRARTVVHTTNRWASHLLPEFTKLILPDRASIAAVKAPEDFIKHTGAQQFDGVVNNYHLQLPPPYNIIIFGGGRQVLCHKPEETTLSDDNDKQIDGYGQFAKTWPASDFVDWPGPAVTELGLDDNEGGVWTGVQTECADNFPFVGPVPSRDGHYIAAGFAGHGMPRVLLTAAHIAPVVLESIGFQHSTPHLAATYPPLPKPFHVSAERIERLQKTDPAEFARETIEANNASAKKPFSNTPRVIEALGGKKPDVLPSYQETASL